MSTETVTLRISEELYQQLRNDAARRNRTVEEEIVERLSTATPANDALPADLEEAINSLHVLKDEELWLAARSRLPAELSSELEELHHKRGREGLSEAEQERAARLLRQYEKCMLVRAQAAALLRQRGHDVSVLLTEP
jgi:hypothetical protein